MIEIRLAEAAGNTTKDQLATDIFTDRFLIKHPLLQALAPDADGAPVLLIDELDRTGRTFRSLSVGSAVRLPSEYPEIGTCGQRLRRSWLSPRIARAKFTTR
jgi:hypothetical protein